MVALPNLHLNFLFSHQMICKQYIVLNHVSFQYESNLEPVTLSWTFPVEKAGFQQYLNRILYWKGHKYYT